MCLCVGHRAKTAEPIEMRFVGLYKGCKTRRRLERETAEIGRKRPPPQPTVLWICNSHLTPSFTLARNFPGHAAIVMSAATQLDSID